MGKSQHCYYIVHLLHVIFIAVLYLYMVNILALKYLIKMKIILIDRYIQNKRWTLHVTWDGKLGEKSRGRN